MHKEVVQVCLVEDDKEIRELTINVLELKKNIQVKYSFSCGEDFLIDYGNIEVDIVLMDIGLPGINGIQCVEQCANLANSPLFIMYTSHSSSNEVFQALKVGAKGYLLKGSSPERLIQDIYDLVEGGSPMSPQISRMVADSFDRQKKNSGIISKLTKQEWEVLKSLEKGLNYKEIAKEKFVSAHTIRAQIRSIYEKLHVHNKIDAVKMLK